MAHWSLVTYTRPNTDTAWFEPSAEVLALIDTYKNDDLVNPTIETYEKIESADKLKQYYKISFKDEESSELLADNSVYNTNDHNTVMGETDAVDNFISKKKLKLEKLSFYNVPSFIRKPI